MTRPKLKFEYDRTVDAAYLSFKRGKVAISDEVQPGIVVDLDKNGQVIGLEILNFTRRFVTRRAPSRKKLAV